MYKKEIHSLKLSFLYYNEVYLLHIVWFSEIYFLLY